MAHVISKVEHSWVRCADACKGLCTVFEGVNQRYFSLKVLGRM